MAVTSGFFNSLQGDRKYTAEQFSELFNGLINDGVFSNIGTAFRVSAATDNGITIGIGRAWFNGIWVNNDAILPMTCNDPEVLLDRIDALVIEINRSEAVRAGRIIFVKGVASGEPVKPELTHDEGVDQYPLAYIRRKANVTEVVQADITNCIGTSECPYVTGILETQNIDSIVAQWESLFDIWFDGLQTELEGDVAANLASQIIELNSRFTELAETRTITVELEDSSLDVIEDSTGAAILGSTVFENEGTGESTVVVQPETEKDEFDGFEIGDILTTTRSDIFEDERWKLCNGASVSANDYPDLARKRLKIPAGNWSIKTISGLVSPTDYEDGHIPQLTKPVFDGSNYIFAMRGANKVNVYKLSSSLGSITRYTIMSGLANWKHNTIRDIAYGNGYYVVITSGNVDGSSSANAVYASYSKSLSGSWTTVTLWQTDSGNADSDAYSVSFINGKFIVCGFCENLSDYKAYACFAYAENPSAWTVKNIKTINAAEQYNAGLTAIKGVRFLNDQYVFFGQYRISAGEDTDSKSCIWRGSSLEGSFTSHDVSSTIVTSRGYGLDDIIYVNGQYIGVGDVGNGDRLWFSSNLSSFTSRETGDSLVGNPGEFVGSLYKPHLSYIDGFVILFGYRPNAYAYILSEMNVKSDIWTPMILDESKDSSSGTFRGVCEEKEGEILALREVDNDTFYSCRLNYSGSTITLPTLSISDEAYTFIKVLDRVPEE